MTAANIVRKHGIITTARSSSTSSSAASSASGQTIPSPNRFTVAFQHMKQTCPQHMEAYAACVILHHHAGTLERHCCNDEFRKLNECFKACLAQNRSSNGRGAADRS